MEDESIGLPHHIFLNGPTSASFSFICGLFKQTIIFLQQINAKNVHPVYGDGIQTHDLSNMSVTHNH